MKNLIKMICTASVMSVFWIGIVMVGTVGAEVVAPGACVGGGGASGGSGTTMTGNVPLTGTGVATSANFLVQGGVIAAAFGQPGEPAFAATFAGSSGEIVLPGDKLLKVGYANGSGTVTGTCYYRLGGATTFASTAMTAGTGDTLVYTIPSASVGVRGLEFYFRVNSGDGSTVSVGSSGEPFIYIVEMNNAQSQRPRALPATQYRIIGAPLNLTGMNTSAAVFGDDFGEADPTSWRLGSYNNGTGEVNEYPMTVRVTPGRGFWLIMRTPASYGAESHSMRPNNFDYTTDYYEVPLDSGWNQVANPYAFDVDWPAVRFTYQDAMVPGHDTSVVEDFAYVYVGNQYSTASSIPGWDGFFVFVKKPEVSILFPYQEDATKMSAKPLRHIAETIAPDNWSVHLQMEAGELTDNGNFIGVREGASFGDDGFDISEPPSAPDAPRLAFRLPEGDPRLRRADYRAPFNDGADWNLDITLAPGRVITASGIDNLPDGMEALLILDNGSGYTLEENGKIELPETTTSARLFIGTTIYLANEAPSPLPIDFALHQNYPNPFNPFTSINFALPESRFVTLEVYNIIGQRVKMLISEDLEAGEYREEWHGDDEQGKQVASGIYFYRIKAGDFIQSRKMLLLK